MGNPRSKRKFLQTQKSSRAYGCTHVTRTATPPRRHSGVHTPPVVTHACSPHTLASEDALAQAEEGDVDVRPDAPGHDARRGAPPWVIGPTGEDAPLPPRVAVAAPGEAVEVGPPREVSEGVLPEGVLDEGVVVVRSRPGPVAAGRIVLVTVGQGLGRAVTPAGVADGPPPRGRPGARGVPDVWDEGLTEVLVGPILAPARPSARGPLLVQSGTQRGVGLSGRPAPAHVTPGVGGAAQWDGEADAEVGLLTDPAPLTLTHPSPLRVGSHECPLDVPATRSCDALPSLWGVRLVSDTVHDYSLHVWSRPFNRTKTKGKCLPSLLRVSPIVVLGFHSVDHSPSVMGLSSEGPRFWVGEECYRPVTSFTFSFLLSYDQ